MVESLTHLQLRAPVAMSMMYPSDLRDVRMSSFCEGETQAYEVYCTSALQDGFP